MLRLVEEVIVEVLEPGAGVFGREIAKAYSEEVHMYECDLGPCTEGGRKAKI